MRARMFYPGSRTLNSRGQTGILVGGVVVLMVAIGLASSPFVAIVVAVSGAVFAVPMVGGIRCLRAMETDSANVQRHVQPGDGEWETAA